MDDKPSLCGHLRSAATALHFVRTTSRGRSERTGVKTGYIHCQWATARMRGDVSMRDAASWRQGVGWAAGRSGPQGTLGLRLASSFCRRAAKFPRSIGRGAFVSARRPGGRVANARAVQEDRIPGDLDRSAGRQGSRRVRGHGCGGLRRLRIVGTVEQGRPGPVHPLACICARWRGPRHTNPLPSTINTSGESAACSTSR
jgi:hypothetical protein